VVDEPRVRRQFGDGEEDLKLYQRGEREERSRGNRQGETEEDERAE